MNQRDGLTRRGFLGSLGAFGAAAFGSALLPSSILRAETPGAPKRFVLVFSPNGLHNPEWTPDDGFNLRRILKPLEEFKDQLLVLKNLDWQSYFADPAKPANDHPPPLSHCLCATSVVDYVAGSPGVGDAWGGGPSIDQFIADRMPPTRFRSLVLSAEDKPKRHRLSYRAARQDVPPIANPQTAWDLLFQDLGDSPELEQLRAERKSVIDLVGADLAALQSRLGSDDRRKVDAHLTHLRAIEQRLVSGASCGPEPLNPYASLAQFPRHVQQHTDLLALALACDLTRVGFLEWDGAVTTHRWITGIDKNHHGYSHYNAGLTTAENDERLTRIGEWYGQQVLYLLRALDSIPEGDGSVLDNTLVLWTSEQKQMGGAHHRRDLPFLLAGGAGGFRGGRKLDFGGRAHNDLYVSVCHAMGFDDVTTFGNPDVCEGPLTGLT